MSKEEDIQHLTELYTKLNEKEKQIKKAKKQIKKELVELKGETTLTITKDSSNRFYLFARESMHTPVYVTSGKDYERIQQIKEECTGKTMIEVWDIKEKYRKNFSKSCKKYGGTLYE